MQYSSKLKKAMLDIKAVLKRYDIAGSIVLHTPGHAEHLLYLTPTYSCCKVNGDEVRFRAKLKEDFNGDKKAWEEKVRDTVNMVDSLATTSAHTSMMLFDLEKKLESKIEITHLDRGFTSQTTQLN